MKQELITQLSQSFNQTSHTWEGSEIEYWYAGVCQASCPLF